MNVRTLKKHREPVADCPQPDGREIDGFARILIAKRERGEMDTKRLDWIERHGSTSIEYVTDFPSGVTTFQITDFDDNTVKAKTLRDALDAAMRRWPRN